MFSPASGMREPRRVKKCRRRRRCNGKTPPPLTPACWLLKCLQFNASFASNARGTTLSPQGHQYSSRPARRTSGACGIFLAIESAQPDTFAPPLFDA
jgi:hypothetical protein